MQFLDLAGLKELWLKIKAGDATAKTTVNGDTNYGEKAAIVVTPTTLDGDGQDGHTNYELSLVNVASKADVTTAKEALYGGTIPSTDALTLTGLNSAISNAQSAGTVTITEAAGSGDTLKVYTFTQNGSAIGAVNIPKDFLVKSGSVREATAEDEGFTVGEKILDFVVNTVGGDGTGSHILIAVSDLVDTYTGSNGVAVDGSNNITAVVDSAANGNEFLSVSATGLKVSGISSAIATAKSEVIGNASTDTASSSTIEGAKKYADEAVANVADNYATADQGTKADSALQSISKGTDGTYVTTTIGTKTNNDQTVGVAVTTATVADSGTTDGLAVASDVKTYVDTAVSNKNVSAVGETGDSALVTGSATGNTVTVGSTSKLQSAVTSAESAIQGVKVNSSDLTPDANHKVNVNIAEGTTDGTIAVNGTDVAVHGLGSMAYENKNDYASSAQGSAADTALQSISEGADGDYINITVTPKGTGTSQTVSGTVTVQAVASSSSSAMGLAEASDVKNYVDSKFTNLGEITRTASGTASNSGVFVVDQIVEENGALKSIRSVEVEQAGAAANVESTLRGDSSAAGYVANDTLAALRNDINSITGGSGSIATQIADAIDGLDSSITASASRNAVEAEPDTAVFTTVSIVNGELDSTTSAGVLIGGIPVSTLDTILV